MNRDSELTLEDLLIHEGLDYKEVSGNKGQQLHIRECQNPECQADTWKVYANAETGLGNCFKCGKTFNVFGFVRLLLKNRGGEPSNRDVGLYIADIARRLGYRPRIEKPKVVVAVHDGEVTLPFSTPLPYSNGNHPYLDRRGISGEWAQKFNLRFSAFGTHKYLNDKGEEVSQNFSNRIIVPVPDLNGVIRTFQGRDVTDYAEDKYKFAGGLPGTARYLYNGHVAYALKAQHVCMGEGAFDVIPIQIALSQFADSAGVIAIGSWGMHLTKSADGDDQVTAFQKLRQVGLQIVTIMWDGEPKAYERALEAAELLLKVGLRVRIATLPAGKDPNEVDARVVHQAWQDATEVTRLSLLRLKMKNPYSPRK